MKLKSNFKEEMGFICLIAMFSILISGGITSIVCLAALYGMLTVDSLSDILLAFVSVFALVFCNANFFVYLRRNYMEVDGF